MLDIHPMITLQYITILFVIGTIILGMLDCWRNPNINTVPKVVYTIVLLFPIIGLAIYLRDKSKFSQNAAHLSRGRQRDPWEL